MTRRDRRRLIDRTLDALRAKAEELGDPELAHRIALRPAAIYRQVSDWWLDVRDLAAALRGARASAASSPPADLRNAIREGVREGLSSLRVAATPAEDDVLPEYDFSSGVRGAAVSGGRPSPSYVVVDPPAPEDRPPAITPHDHAEHATEFWGTNGCRTSWCRRCGALRWEGTAYDGKWALPSDHELAIWYAYHRAWTAAVGTPLYDKAAWKAGEAQLLAAGFAPVTSSSIRGVHYPCERCGKKTGGKLDDRGFYRCVECGYPGQ